MKTKIALIALTFATAANAHTHISVGVNAAGTGLQFLTYGDPAMLTADGHFADTNGTPIVTTLASTATNAPFAGFATGASPTLTTDYYSSVVGSSPPAWVGADVWLEFASVTPVLPTSRLDNVVGFSIPQGEFSYQDALTNAATLADRSVDYGNGNHIHGISLYSLYAGTYDVSIIAHDLRTTGTPLADATPLVLRITAVPEPTAAFAMIGLGGVLLRRWRNKN